MQDKEAWRARLNNEFTNGEVENMLDHIDALNARIKELEEALRPFADYYGIPSELGLIDYRNIKRAAEVLAKRKKPW